jgi:hypothetical protein
MKLPFVRRPALVAPSPAAPSRGALPRRARGISWLLLAPFLLLAFFIGLVGGLDSPALVAVVGAAVMSVVLFFLLNISGLFWCLLVLTFVIQGSALYFAGLRSATWMAFGLALMFFFRGLLDLVTRAPQRLAARQRVPGAGVIWGALLYLTCFFVSMVFNRIPAAQVLSAVKSGLPMFSVLFCWYWFNWEQRRLELTWRWMLAILVVQLPVVVYQHFFIATSHTFDSIVGTFGGTPGAGGNSAILVFFAVVVMVYALARWDAGRLGRWQLAAIFLLGFAIILLGEVKAAFIWVPLASAWVLRRRLLKSIYTLVSYMVLTMVFMGATYAVYNALYWGKIVERQGTVRDKLNAGGGYFFDPNNVNYLTGEISRGASLAIWWRDQNSSMPKRLVGFGPGASKPAGLLGAGDVAKRFAPLHLDATSLAILLWDVGVLGALAYGGMLIAAIRAGLRYLREGRGSLSGRYHMEAAVTSLIMFVSMLIYNRAMMDEPTCQLLLMICLGTVVQLCRYDKAEAPA